ncbi:MAG: MFS transporter [Muribaculaceae bacterium]|nr:MFS transporter [Muribaculaceae bacterium]
MKYISNGRGEIPLISLIALLSVSLVVNLPGLAVSPMLGKVADIFPHASQLEVQLLTLLPNLVIIPMILISGKITTVRNQTVVLAIGLAIFLLSGILYLSADTMPMLVGLGALLGVGCGLVVPIAAGQLSEYFYGAQNAKVLGFKSGTSNGIVILATIFVGWAADISWHTAFCVYLVPVIPLMLLPFMTNTFLRKHIRVQGEERHRLPDPGTPEAQAHRCRFAHPLLTLAGVIGLYIALTATSMVFTYYLPFTMKHYGFTASQVGLATAMFYLTAMLGGFGLTPYIRAVGRLGLYVCIIIMVAGLLTLGVFHTMPAYVTGVLLIGLGYGFFQPIIYDKTTQIAPTKALSTKYFSYTLAGNYVALSVIPVIVEFFQRIFDNHTADFPYYLSASILGVIFLIGFVKRHSFVWLTGDDKPCTPPRKQQ